MLLYLTEAIHSAPVRHGVAVAIHQVTTYESPGAEYSFSLEAVPVRHSRVGSFLLSLLLLALTSCGGSDDQGPTGPDTPGGTTLSISQTSVTMSFLGETLTLNAALRDQNGQPVSGSISWSTDNPSVVTAAAGV